jgi:hypothetical protein
MIGAFGVSVGGAGETAKMSHALPQRKKAFAAQQENAYSRFADPLLRVTDWHPRNLRRISKTSPVLRDMFMSYHRG